MAKTKRNDPCPCGSGKKYKHCCSDKEVQLLHAAKPWGRDTEWLKIRRTEGEVVMGILEFVVGEWPGLLEVGAEVSMMTTSNRFSFHGSSSTGYLV